MKTSKNILFGAAALLSALPAVQAAPTFITTAQGRGADLNIRGGPGFGSSNFGDHEFLRVRNTANLGDARKTYMRFDLSSLPMTVKNATGVTLGLQIAPAEGKSLPTKTWTFNVSGLNDAANSENWDEKAANWSNAPANDASSALKLSPEVKPLGSFTISGTGTAGQKIAFSSPAFLDFLKSDTNGIATLIITRQEVGDGADNDVLHIFASKENAAPAPPVLSVAFGGENAALPDATQWAGLPAVTKPLPYEEDIARFEASDRLNPPAKGGIVFVGSSSIRLWDSLARDFPNQNVINRGFGGSKIIDSVHFAQRIVTPYAPKMIVFYAGTNDIADGKTPETLLADYQAFVAQVRTKLPTTPIAYIAIVPSPSRWAKIGDIRKANAMIAQFSQMVPNLKFIDIVPLMLDANGQPRPELFVEDQLHMNAAGYAIWKKAVAPYLPAP